MVESIQNRIYHRLNQLQIESTINRIYQRLNLFMVAKSKKVKVESQGKSKTYQSAGLLRFTTLKSSSPVGFQGLPTPAPLGRSTGRYLRAGELEAASWKLGRKLGAGARADPKASCELRAGLVEVGRAANYKLNVKSTLKKMHVHLN